MAASGNFGSDGASLITVLVPILISLLAVYFTGANFIRAERKDARDAVWEYLVLLTSEQIVTARNTVGEAARSGGPVHRSGNFGSYIDSGDTTLANHYRGSIFQLMWIVQLARPIVTRYVKRKNIATPEAVEVYEHLNLIVADLDSALRKWGSVIDWQDSGERTNEALNGLPPVKNGFYLSKAKLTGTRLPTTQE